MKKIALALTFLSSAAILPSAFAQGSLTPPGAPAPTMQTLDQLGAKLDQVNSKATTLDAKSEKRIPINATNTPGNTVADFVIAQPGSYYLTANLNVTKTTGISISAPGVTVDLNGFQIAHTSGSGDGIQILGTALRCAIGNGSVTGFLGSGISGLARGGAIFHVSASNCSNGFSVDESWRIESCTALDNTFNGINTTSGAVISNCAASNNGGSGIAVGNGATIQASLAIGNRGFAGIATGNGCTLIQCTARGNTGANNSQSTGIFTGSGSTITACTADSNTSTSASTSGLNGSGISAGDNSKVQDCSASSNKGDGIRAARNCIILSNTASNNGAGNSNGAAGIHITGNGNRIEGNNATDNTSTGFLVDANAGNLVIRNNARGNFFSYIFPQGHINIVGTLVTTSAQLNAANNSNVNISNVD